ncbi:MAG: lipoprotein [Gammaproteobacteria bacterium]|nr:lipoprotein [Gammaproteobacteria bacterium]
MHSRPRYLPWIVIVLLTLSSMLSACGQKGPLYLPQPDQEQQERE